MTCSHVRDILALYAGGDLASPRDAREVEAHVAQCDACRAELKALRRSLDVLGEAALGEEMLPAEDGAYWHEVESKLRERALGVDKLRLGLPSWRSVPAVLAQAALVLVVAGAVVWFMAHPGGPKAPAVAPAVAKLEKRRPPVIVLVRQSDRYANGEVSPVPAGGDVSYSDFNHVVQPGDVRRFRERAMPAAFTEAGGPF